MDEPTPAVLGPDGARPGLPVPEADVDALAEPDGAPPVVAVIVVGGPGDELEVTLAALRTQDYPNLAVLVLAVRTEFDPTPRVAAVMPNAYVRRTDALTRAAAANEVIGTVEGAPFYVFVRPRTSPEPPAVRLLVEEAFRSNAGIVGPKLVDADRPELLVEVGLAVDRFGVPYSGIEPGELDQEQHDAVRDVFYVPGDLLLVRADLFAALGGFDAGLTGVGEDLDLCWRARIAGARIVVAPDARARVHAEEPAAELRALAARARVRTLLKVYSLLSLALLVPQILVLTTLESFVLLVTGRRAAARSMVGAWVYNLRRGREIRTLRRPVQASRRIPDSEVRSLQVRGSVRLRDYVMGRLEADGRARSLARSGRELVGAATTRWQAVHVATWCFVGLLLLVGSRELITGGVPAVGSFARWPGLAGLVRDLTGGWRFVGLGSASPPPPALAVLAALTSAVLGASGLARTIVVVGAIPAGAVATLWLARRIGLRGIAPHVGAIAYALNPVARNAIASGRLGPLVFSVAFPLLAGLLVSVIPSVAAPATNGPPAGRPHGRATHPPSPLDLPDTPTDLDLPYDGGHLESTPAANGSASGRGPHAEPDPVPSAPAGLTRTRILAFGLLLAVVAALAPPALVLIPSAGLGLLAGSLAARTPRAGIRAVLLALAGTLVAFVLLLPWSLTLVVPGSDAASLGFSFHPHVAVADLVRFHTGVAGGGRLGWGLLAAGALPLVIAREPLLAWTTRAWALVIIGWAWVWVASQGFLPIAWPAPEGPLVIAAVGLALAAALGAAAFADDLASSSFGWRHAAAAVAAAGLVAGLLPFASAALGGRFDLPARDWATSLSWMDADRSGFRVLWAGEPGVLPLDAWSLPGGLGYGLTRDGVGDARGLWPATSSGTTGVVGDALRAAMAGHSERVGHLLAPAGVRYIAVPLRRAPGHGPVHRGPGGAALEAALAGQVDLKRLQIEPGSLLLYENTAWAPAGAVLAPAAATAARHERDGLRTDIAGASPALGRRGWIGARGPVRTPGLLLWPEAYDRRWEARRHGKVLRHVRAFHVVNGFVVDRPGRVTVRYRGEAIRIAGLVVELGLWVVALRMWRRGRRAAA
jgi:GT2 family glycosyltransferase